MISMHVLWIVLWSMFHIMLMLVVTCFWTIWCRFTLVVRSCTPYVSCLLRSPRYTVWLCTFNEITSLSISKWYDGITCSSIYIACSFKIIILEVFLRNHLLMYVPPGTQYYYFMVPPNEKLTDHLAWSLVVLLLNIFYTNSFSMFNILGKGREMES